MRKAKSDRQWPEPDDGDRVLLLVKGDENEKERQGILKYYEYDDLCTGGKFDRKLGNYTNNVELAQRYGKFTLQLDDEEGCWRLDGEDRDHYFSIDDHDIEVIKFSRNLSERMRRCKTKIRFSAPDIREIKSPLHRSRSRDGEICRNESVGSPTSPEHPSSDPLSAQETGAIRTRINRQRNPSQSRERSDERRPRSAPETPNQTARKVPEEAFALEVTLSR